MEEIVHISGLIHAHVSFGQFGTAKIIYKELLFYVEELSHDDMVSLINKVGVTDHRAGWIGKAWCESHHIKHATLEFHTASCTVDSIGQAFEYRRGKKTWGDLVGITEYQWQDPATLRQITEDILRINFSLKENNPIRLKQTTRNEVKLLIGSKLVNSAMASKKGEFVSEVGPYEAARIQRVTGLPIGQLWSAIKKGDQNLVDRLSLIPNSKREQMRKRGMFVAPHYEPQLTLF